MRDAGHGFEVIHASLKNGARAEPPTEPPEVIESQSGSQGIVLLQRQLTQLREALGEARTRIEALEQVEAERNRLVVELEFEQRERSKLEAKMVALEQEIRELYREVGREYAKGYVDAMSQEPPEAD
jgi:SMC interacting uncharacterized protein involved in chromosome segregation